MRLLCYLLMTFPAYSAQTGQPVVEVFLPAPSSAEMVRAFQEARGVVDAIYSEIGVRVEWRMFRSVPATCTRQPFHMQIVVAFQFSSPAALPPAAMAFSNPYATDGPCVTLLMDRLKPQIRMNPVRTGFLLGHILAHEMGHALQGISRHSETGVMKARWSLHETSQMWSYERLHFSSDDADLILLALQSYTEVANR